MRLDSLVRLIGSSDFMSFRQIAIEYLQLRGFVQAELRDGWNDGGTDFSVHQLPPNPTPIAIQVSVEKRWKSKLKEDALKAKNKLGLENLMLISSRRISETDFHIISDEIWRSYSVRVSRADNQSIASIFYSNEKTGQILEILGIRPQVPKNLASQISFSKRAEAIYSCLFFGLDSRDFRNEIFESTIISVCSRAGALISRESLLKEVSEILALAEQQEAYIISTVDRMMQRGELITSNKLLGLNVQLTEATTSMNILRDEQWNRLYTKVSEFLTEKNGSALSGEQVGSIMDRLGALIMDAGDTTEANAFRSNAKTFVHSQLRKRLRELHSTLDAIGFPEGSIRDNALEELVSLVSRSPLGEHIVAGELFMSMRHAKLPELIQALGAKREVEVLLDASVAIPILSGCLYEPSQNRYFLGAEHGYNQLVNLNIHPYLPIDYLEEVTAHLIDAYRYYRSVVDTEPDLTASTNAFVAHYVSLQNEGNSISFEDYLAGFEFTPKIGSMQFFSARDILIPRLQRLFGRYGIESKPLSNISQRARKSAQIAITYALEEREETRPSVLLKHDARTIAYLNENSKTNETARIFCTWDNLHFAVTRREDSLWDVFDPSVLGDILSLVSEEDSTHRMLSPVILAKSITNRTAQRGARVWDVLVGIEKDNMHDAKILSMAREFKEHFLSNTNQGLGKKDIQERWLRWKTDRDES
mgnify:CR=1 FL=1